MNYLDCAGALTMMKFTMKTDFELQTCLQPVYKSILDTLYTDSATSFESAGWANILESICATVHTYIPANWVNEVASLKSQKCDPKDFFVSRSHMNKFLCLRATCISSLLGQFARSCGSDDGRLLCAPVFGLLSKKDHHSLIAVGDALVEDPSEVYHFWHGILSWLHADPKHCDTSLDDLQCFIDELKVQLGLIDAPSDDDDPPLADHTDRANTGQAEQPPPVAETVVMPSTDVVVVVPQSTGSGSSDGALAVAPHQSESPPTGSIAATATGAASSVSLALNTVQSDWIRNFAAGADAKCRSWMFIKQFMLKAELLLLERMQKNTLTNTKYTIAGRPNQV